MGVGWLRTDRRIAAPLWKDVSVHAPTRGTATEGLKKHQGSQTHAYRFILSVYLLRRYKVNISGFFDKCLH